MKIIDSYKRCVKPALKCGDIVRFKFRMDTGFTYAMIVQIEGHYVLVRIGLDENSRIGSWWESAKTLESLSEIIYASSDYTNLEIITDKCELVVRP